MLENATVEKNKSPSGPLADEFIRSFLQGEPIPGIVYEYALNQRFLPEITLAEINALAKEWAPDRNRVVAIIAPEKDKATVPDAENAAVIAAASGAPLDAYVDTVSTQPLLEPLPSPGSIATTSTNEPLGITEWLLSNGVRVVLKPTTFKEDRLCFAPSALAARRWRPTVTSLRRKPPTTWLRKAGWASSEVSISTRFSPAAACR